MDCVVDKDTQYGTLEAFFALAQEFKDPNIRPNGSRDRAIGYMKSLEYIQTQLRAMSPLLGGLWTEQKYADNMWKQTAPTVLKFTIDSKETIYEEVNPGSLRDGVSSTLVNFNGKVEGLLPVVPEGDGRGCDRTQWTGDLKGKVAILESAGCPDSFACSKIEYAVEAGAEAVIIVFPNDTISDLRRRIRLRSCPPTVPVASVPFEVGQELLGMGGEATSISLEARSEFDTSGSSNLCLDLPGGDKSKVVMIGAHLDSVMYGAGANDNGSGSALVLEIVRAWIQRYGKPDEPTDNFAKIKNSFRVCWWGSEEWGLIGSRRYVNLTAKAELDKILGYINFDMMAGPNGVNFVNNGKVGDKYNPCASGHMHQSLRDAFEAWGEPSIPGGWGGSDFFSFYEGRIPSSGLLSGVSACTESQAETFGCTAGVSKDVCYHQSCDVPSHVDKERQHLMSKVAARVSQQFLEDETLDEKLKRQNLKSQAVLPEELFDLEPEFDVYEAELLDAHVQAPLVRSESAPATDMYMV